MDAIKEIIRGQKATLHNGDVVTLLERGRTEGNIIALSPCDRKTVIRESYIKELVPCQTTTKAKRHNPKFEHPEMFERNKNRGW